jgi:tetratricopeptide (TPR) repeat protein/TolB-like protein
VTNKKQKGASHLCGKGASHLLVAALLLLAPVAAAQRATDGRILVIPFENGRHEQRLQWLSEASAVLLADDLRARGLPAISRDERVRAFEDLHLPLSAALSRATVIKVGRLVGASQVVVGTFAIDGNTLKVDANTIRVDAGRLEPSVSEQAPLTDLFASFARLASRIAPDSRAPATSPAYPPPTAFENYIKGLVAETPAAQATFLERAITLHPGYDRAELALWNVRAGLADHVSALAAARAVSSSSPLSRRARFLAGVSLVQLKRYDEAFAAFKSLLDEAAPSADKSVDISAAWNNLGVIQVRRGSTPETGAPVFFLTKAAEASPGDSDILFNLGYAYMLERNTQAATYWLREAVRRDPGDADAHFVLAAALQSSAAEVEAGRERELARRLSSRYEELERRAAAEKMPVPKGLDRIRIDPDAPAGGGPDASVSSPAQQDQRDLVKFHVERGQRLYERGADGDAMSELRRAVYLSPYEAQAHLLIGRIHLRAGRPQEAVNALKISIWSEDTVAARIALADAYLKLQNTAAARAELERALTLDPNSADAKRMLGTIK